MRRIIGVSLSTLFLTAACSSSIAYRIPTTPPPGVAAKQVDAVAECEEKVAPPGSDHRGLTYTSCMIARGYTAYVEVPIWGLYGGEGSSSMPYDVTPTRPHERTQVLTDLGDCAATMRKERPSTTSSVAAGALGVLAFGMPFSGAVDEEVVQRVYGACMGERGYSIKRWSPPPSPFMEGGRGR